MRFRLYIFIFQELNLAFLFSVMENNIQLDHISNQFKLLDQEEELEKRLEDLKAFLVIILKECVESEKPVALKRILFWIKKDLAAIPILVNSLFSNIAHLEEEEKEDGFFWNNQAMIRACEKNNFTMVSHFMCINSDQKLKFRINDSTFKDKYIGISTNILCENNDKELEVLKHIRNFQATCSPVFLIAKFKKNIRNKVYDFDPIDEAFKCIDICRSQEDRFHEYGDQFRKVQKSLEDFLGRH